jgi:hypothetical protein
LIAGIAKNPLLLHVVKIAVMTVRPSITGGGVNSIAMTSRSDKTAPSADHSFRWNEAREIKTRPQNLPVEGILALPIVMHTIKDNLYVPILVYIASNRGIAYIV